MKFDEFKKNLKEDQELSQKFKDMINEKKSSSEEEKWQIASDAAKALGYDVDASEFAIESRSRDNLSNDELEKVVGGGNGFFEVCIMFDTCTETLASRGSKKQTCYADYVCGSSFNTCGFSDECTLHATCNTVLCCDRNDSRHCDGGYGGGCTGTIL